MSYPLMNPEKIEEILTRGVHEVFTKEDLKEKLLSGRILNIKLGTDVTGPHLHLGHASIHRKIRDLQELGHKVTLIIGDFTTLVGDHSDKVDMRTEADPELIKENEKNYQEQFFRTIKKEGTEIKHNSEWLSKLGFLDVIKLAQPFTVSQMLDREAFALRYSAGKPIGLDEFLYPLMQGYDSVVLDTDIELGGTDQTFNLLAGRKLMQLFGKTPQSAIAMRPLVGSDGRQMGKSLQNYIPITSEPADMYGKIMAVVDEVIFEYFELLTRIPMSEIHEMKKKVEDGENPMQFKKILAREIVSFYHGENKAEEAEEVWVKTFSEKITPENISEVSVSKEDTLLEVLTREGFAQSNSQARALIEQGGVRFITESAEEVMVDPKRTFDKDGTLKIGKHRFVKIKI